MANDRSGEQRMLCAQRVVEFLREAGATAYQIDGAAAACEEAMAQAAPYHSEDGSSCLQGRPLNNANGEVGSASLSAKLGKACEGYRLSDVADAALDLCVLAMMQLGHSLDAAHAKFLDRMRARSQQTPGAAWVMAR